MQPTPEQSSIIACPARTMKVRAFAGTGKTTTLRGLAFRVPQHRLLYLAFNKAIKEEATGKFPRNTQAMTAHGLAYRDIGKHYGNVKDKLQWGLRPFHVLPSLGASLRLVPSGVHNLYGARVIETVQNFLVSADMAMTGQHVNVGNSPAEKKYMAPENILADAHLIWEQMQDLDHAMPMVHDGYLKLFQLTNPKLPYDLVMVDEYQDTNPVVQDLVDRFQGRLVLVGDEHQAIYGFRGAVNAMNSVQTDAEHYLTGSFRFGKAVADVANAILAAKGEKHALRGLGGPSQMGKVPANTAHAFIARGNSALFSRAVQAIEKNESFAFVGPLNNYRLDLIEQVYRLSKRDKVNDPFLKAFDSFESLEAYAEAMEDRDIAGRCKLVTKYGPRLPGLLQQITQKAGTYPSPTTYRVTLTSAHRAKGLEFDHVQLADDFMDFYDEKTETWKDLTQTDAHTQEEINLQYVAATRAKQTLELGEKLQKFWNHTQASAAQERQRIAQGVVDPVKGRVAAGTKSGVPPRAP
jgi:F-box protein, helicase, 18